MKTAKIFLCGMYLHFLLSIGVIAGLVFLGNRGEQGGQWNASMLVLLLCYLLMAAVLQITGCICAGAAIAAYKQREDKKLRKAMKMLKLGSIPFFILNFILSTVVFGAIAAAPPGFGIILAPIPVIFTCALIVESGCVGICYVMYLRTHPVNGRRPLGIHYLLQLISLLDIISTIVILARYKQESKEQ